MVYETLLRANARFPRKGEGDIAVLKNGDLLLAYTEFYSGGSDFSPARIIKAVSRDNGRTWENFETLQENVGKCNVMSVSLLRLKSGELAIFYLVKNSFSDCRVYMRKSFDEGETWSEPLLVTEEERYFVLNNDRVVQLSSGRIIVPVAVYQNPVNHSCWKSFIFYSDDGGESWRKSSSEVALRDIDSQAGLQEPGVVELKNGRLMMYMRAALGYIYVSFSKDEGESWSRPEPLDDIKAPLSPSTIKRIPSTGDLLLVWNDKSMFDLSRVEKRGADIVDKKFQRRTPLSCAVSRDEGVTWVKLLDLEDSRNYTYCYPSVTFKKDYIIFSYYFIDDKYAHLKIKVLTLSELYRKLL
ncbi:MAG: exo-alpha-sialidase [Thermoprotei archaeon]|nr:MAG: exo-alpha-sialidase [Thermoprotei archaeon]